MGASQSIYTSRSALCLMSGYVYSSILRNDSFLARKLRQLMLRTRSVVMVMVADFLPSEMKTWESWTVIEEYL